MTMNKTERATFDAAVAALESARSMRWPEYDRPQPMTGLEIEAGLSSDETPGRRVCRGWFMNDYAEGSISYGASTGHSHCREFHTEAHRYNGFSQGMGAMYRTKKEALRALRYIMTEKYAAQLAVIDRKLRAHD